MRTTLDLPQALIEEAMRLTNIVTKTDVIKAALQNLIQKEKITQFNGAPAGQTVFHLHFHIIPRWDGVALGRHGQGMADMDELKALAAKISAKMA